MAATKTEWREIEAPVAKRGLQAGDSVIGKYISKDENSGSYKVETETGIVDVPSSRILSGKMSTVKVGSMVKLVYQGIVKSEGSKRGKAGWQVFVK